MKRGSPRQWGVTLVELVVVISIMALLLGVAVPGIRALKRAFHSEDAVISMVDTALMTARSLALERGRYVGVRFQKRDQSSNVSPSEGTLRRVIEAQQSMLFIEDSKPDDNAENASAFRVMPGKRPVDLPMGNTLLGMPENSTEMFDLLDPNQVRVFSTFSVVFSPNGRVVTPKKIQLAPSQPWVVLRADLGSAPDGTAFVADNNISDSVDEFWVCDNLRLRRALMQDALTLKQYIDGGGLRHGYVKPNGGVLAKIDPNGTNP